MLPPTLNQLYLVSIRFWCKISFVMSFTISKWLKKSYFLEDRGYFNQTLTESEANSWSDVEDERSRSRSRDPESRLQDPGTNTSSSRDPVPDPTRSRSQDPVPYATESISNVVEEKSTKEVSAVGFNTINKSV